MKFKDFCTFKEGYVNPSQKIASYFDGPIKWLRATDLNNSYVYNTSRTLTEEGFKSAGKSSILFKPDTIAISKSGTIGRIGILKDYMCGNRAIINIEVNQEKMNLRYVFYWLLNQQNYIQNLAVGSVQKNLYISVLEQLEIADRPLREQKAIADILSALDDKIELNNQINKNLEEMAQAIFKSWFVDFEPFQDGEFVESELGLIPKGWEVGRIGDVLELAYGKALKKENRVEGPYPVYGSNGIVGFHNEFLVKGPGIVVGRKGNPGTVRYVTENFYPIDTTFYVIPNDPLLITYLYFSLQLQNLESLSSDSAVPGLNRNIAYKNLILIPPNNIIERFNEFIDSLFNLKHTNEKQINTLSNLRDTLLPKLMSGEIRVPLENEGRHQDEQLQRV
ncbi:restriction endonuclease subunit S [Laceyella sacchari]|nr:restriction endonuclease subunit S [Laceyella sacchari]